jgi:Tol biopolymer transport system component/DNA-binding winged helix-turn-helix (wHTH) protein
MHKNPVPLDRRSFRFGPFLVDPRRRLLWKDGTLVPLTPRAFEILATLLDRSPDVVTKDELIDRIWPDTAVGENTLTRHISTLRKALDERPDQHQYIVTIPGHGYQFVADVVESDEHLALPAGPIAQPAPLEMMPALSTAGPPAGTPADAPAGSPGGTRFLTIAVLLTISIVGAIALLMQRGLRSPDRAADRVLRQFTYHSGLQREPTWSPDGQWVAYTSDRGGNSDIWIQSLADPSPTRITSSASEDSQPDWSPDGRWLVFRSERESGGLYVVPARGGFERKIAPFGYQPRWSPDGSMILFSSSGHLGGTPRIYTVGLDGSTPQPVRPDLSGSLKPVHVAWKPGDGRISVLQRDTPLRFLTTAIAGGAVTYSEISSAVRQRIDEAGLSLERFVWSRSGRHLYFEGQSHRVRNLWRVTVDPITLAWIDGPERLTTGASDDSDLALSPDGRHVVFTAKLSRTRMWAFPFDAATGRLTGTGEPVTSGGAGEQDADAIDDGSKLVYRVVRDGRQEVWERSIADGREHLLISSPGWFRTRPRWSPDGTSIAYLRRSATGRNPRTDVVVAVLSTGGEERLLTRPGHVDLTPTDWSPDGRWLLGACRKASGPPATCVLSASSSPDRDASVAVVASDASKNLFEQRFSPDQRWISFMAVDTNDAATSTIYIVPVAGGRWTPITEGAWYDDKPHWAPDGRTLYFLSNREGFFNVWGRRIDGTAGVPVGSPFRVTSFNSSRETVSQQLSAMQIAVTSRRLFLPMTETAAELWMLDHVDR